MGVKLEHWQNPYGTLTAFVGLLTSGLADVCKVLPTDYPLIYYCGFS